MDKFEQIGVLEKQLAELEDRRTGYAETDRQQRAAWRSAALQLDVDGVGDPNDVARLQERVAESRVSLQLERTDAAIEVVRQRIDDIKTSLQLR